MKKNILIIFTLVILVLILILFFNLYTNKNSTNISNNSNEINAISKNTSKKLQKNTTILSNTINGEYTNISNSLKNNLSVNTTKKDNIKYSITTKDEIYFTIQATKNGKTISKEFEASASIADTKTMLLPDVGSVALVADSGGEYYGINFYQLVNDEIQLIGSINCGADVVTEATYNVEIKNKNTAIITAKRNDENITKEFKVSSQIINSNIIDFFNLGEFVILSENDGEQIKLQAFKLCQDYITGETTDIENIGSISVYE